MIKLLGSFLKVLNAGRKCLAVALEIEIIALIRHQMPGTDLHDRSHSDLREVNVA